jgi:hypothetical protein
VRAQRRRARMLNDPCDASWAPWVTSGAALGISNRPPSNSAMMRICDSSAALRSCSSRTRGSTATDFPRLTSASTAFAISRSTLASSAVSSFLSVPCSRSRSLYHFDGRFP